MLNHKERGWMTRTEACTALGIGQRALRKRVEMGRVERVKNGRRCWYRPIDEQSRQDGISIQELFEGIDKDNGAFSDGFDTGALFACRTMVHSAARDLFDSLPRKTSDYWPYLAMRIVNAIEKAHADFVAEPESFTRAGLSCN